MPRAEPDLPRRVRLARTAAAVLLALAATGAQGQGGPLRFTPSVAANLTWTNNVDLAPKETRESDFVLTLIPALAVDYDAPRAFVRGYVAVPILLYANTGGENNEVRPLVDLAGRLEVVKDRFFVEASANVQQTYLDPFGQRPSGLVNATDNRLQTQTYRITPYLRGDFGGTTTYLVRNEATWTLLDDESAGVGNGFTNRIFATVNRAPTPYGWGADVERTDYRFEDQDASQYIELARLRGVWQAGPALQLFATAGYERTKFVLSGSDGAIYGAGLRWRPGERTTFDASAEHRFFGTSYAVALEHRMPMSAVNLRASRGITTFPQQLARLPAGSFVPGILNELFLGRIPDPRERAEFIARYMQERGLPILVSDPIALYAQRITLEEAASLTGSLLGARNTLVGSVYRTKSEPITGSGDDIPIPGLIDNTQTGAFLIWTHALSGSASLTARAEGSRTKANDAAIGAATQWAFNLSLNRSISPRTTFVAGARYQGGDSDFGADYREAAVYVGVTYTYR